MSLILLVVILLLVFGGGGGYYGYRRLGLGWRHRDRRSGPVDYGSAVPVQWIAHLRLRFLVERPA